MRPSRPGGSPARAAREREQDLSVAFLLALQRLSPAERAVFILHDLFETPFAEIAGPLGRFYAGLARKRLLPPPRRCCISAGSTPCPASPR